MTDESQRADAAPADTQAERTDSQGASLRQLRAFVLSTGTATWTSAPDGTLTDARQWLAFTGQSVEDPARLHWLDAVHPDDRPAAARLWEAVRADPRPFQHEYRLRRFDGEYRLVSSKGTPLATPTGEVDEWVGIISDVTDSRRQTSERTGLLERAQSERGRAEALSTWLQSLQRVTEGAMSHLDLRDLLRDLLGRIREAMAVDNAAILLLDDDGKQLVVYAARGPEEQVTGKARVPMGRGVAGTIAATREPLLIDDLSLVHVENPLLRETAHSLVGVPLLLHDRLLGVIHVDSARPRHFTEDDSRLLQVIADRIALAIDRSQLFEAERAARLQAESAATQLRALHLVSDVALAHAGLRQLLDALLERIHDMMDVDNVAILLPDEQHTELTLYTVMGPEQQVLGRVHVPFSRGVAGHIAATRAPYIVKDLAAVEVSNPFLQQHFRSLLGVPLLMDDELVGVLHVATTRARTFTTTERDMLMVIGERIARAIARARLYEDAERERAEAAHRVLVLQEATERMDEFLGIASHELRTPLTSLKTNVQMLEYWLASQRGRRPDETSAEYAARTLRSVQPLVARSTGSIARLDRLIQDLLDASRVKENRLEMHVERGDLRTLLADTVEEQRQIHPDRRLTLEVPAEPVLVMMDAGRLAQVVVNYLSNALKYSKREQPVAITLLSDESAATVTVRDHGPGIPAAEHARVWDRFYRVPGIGHQTGSQVGLGLGLYISRDIVERHGGRIGLSSVPGDGSTFSFMLPLVSTS